MQNFAKVCQKSCISKLYIIYANIKHFNCKPEKNLNTRPIGGHASCILNNFLQELETEKLYFKSHNFIYIQKILHTHV